MNIFFIYIIVGICFFFIETVYIFFSDIETNKRKIFIVLDFLAIYFFYAITLLLWLAFVFHHLIIPAIVVFFIIYNIVLFKVIKKIILRHRAERIEEEITDSIIEALKNLADLDYKNAYKILDRAISKNPESSELKNLRLYLENRLVDRTAKQEKVRALKDLSHENDESNLDSAGDDNNG